jgi:DNA invertase Pin-like site-specific DNA recombinase
MVALYVRVSTELQSTDMQTMALIDHCKKNNLKYELFEDFYTGKTMDRPEFQRMMSRICEFDAVYIYKVDRLSRRALDSMLIIRDLTDVGVEIISLTDPFDLTTATGRLGLNMKLVVNQYEVDVIGERTKAGMAALKARGKRFGHLPRPIDIVTARAMLASGISATDVAAKFGLSRSQLYRRLQLNG